MYNGIEGFLLNKNIVSLDPIIEKDPLKKLYSSLCQNFKSAKKLTNRIYKNKSKFSSFKKNKFNKILKDSVHNIDNNQAHVIISNYLNNYIKLIKNKKDYNFDLVKPIDLIKLFAGKILSIKMGYRKYSNQKIGKFNYLIIRQLLNNFFKLNNYQRLNPLKLKQIGKRIFLIKIFNL